MEAFLWPIALSIIGGLVITLASVIAWVGTQIKMEITTLALAVNRTNDTLGSIERDLRGKLADLDRRVAVVEATCKQNGCAYPND